MTDFIILPSLPIYIDAAFIGIVLVCRIGLQHLLKQSTLTFSKNSLTAIYFVVMFWLILQAFLAIKGWYASDTNSFPNHLVKFGILPPLLCLFALLLSKKGRALLESLPLQALHAIHIIRIPVELVLYGLALYGVIPTLMSFEGRNFDILAGLTAPLVAYWGIAKARFNPKVLLAWNLLALALLLNIVIHALLSAPTPIQQFAFDQPNRAILYFPYVWLPTFVVPLVLFCHVAAIRQLWSRQ